MQEYVRACLISFASLPTDARHEGWGRPGMSYCRWMMSDFEEYFRVEILGTKYADVYFRRALLDTIPEIGSSATAPVKPVL
jgi:hypothetical protein